MKIGSRDCNTLSARKPRCEIGCTVRWGTILLLVTWTLVGGLEFGAQICFAQASPPLGSACAASDGPDGRLPNPLDHKEIVIVIPEGPVPEDANEVSGEIQISPDDIDQLGAGSFHWEMDQVLDQLKLERKEPVNTQRILLGRAPIPATPSNPGNKSYLSIVPSRTEISKGNPGTILVKVINPNDLLPGVYEGCIGPFPIKFREANSPDELKNGKSAGNGLPPLMARVKLTIVRGGRSITAIRVVDAQSRIGTGAAVPAQFGKPLRIEFDVDTYGSGPLCEDPGTVDVNLEGIFGGSNPVPLARVTLPMNDVVWHINNTLYKRTGTSAQSSTADANSSDQFQVKVCNKSDSCTLLFNANQGPQIGPQSWSNPVVWSVSKTTPAKTEHRFQPTLVTHNSTGADKNPRNGFWKRHTHRLRVPGIDTPDTRLHIVATAKSPKLSNKEFLTHQIEQDFDLNTEGLAVFPPVAYQGQDVMVVLKTGTDLGQEIKATLQRADYDPEHHDPASEIPLPIEIKLIRHGSSAKQLCYRAGTLRKPQPGEAPGSDAVSESVEHIVIPTAGTWKINLMTKDSNGDQIEKLPAACKSIELKVPLATVPTGAIPKAFFVFVRSTPIVWGITNFSWHIADQSSSFHLPTQAYKTEANHAYELTQRPGFFNHGTVLLGAAYPVEKVGESNLNLCIHAGAWQSDSQPLLHTTELHPNKSAEIALRATFNNQGLEDWSEVIKSIPDSDNQPRTVHFEIPHLVDLSSDDPNDKTEAQEMLLFTSPVEVRIETPDLDNQFFYGVAFVVLSALAVGIWFVLRVLAFANSKRRSKRSAAKKSVDTEEDQQEQESRTDVHTTDSYSPGLLDD